VPTVVRRDAALREAQPDVVHLHDGADDAVDDAIGDDQRDDDQDDEPRPERLVGHLVEGDHHDLGRQDEVGADRAADGHLLLGVLTARRRRGVVVVAAIASQSFSAPS
jgi:hypothetical protein